MRIEGAATEYDNRSTSRHDRVRSEGEAHNIGRTTGGSRKNLITTDVDVARRRVYQFDKLILCGTARAIVIGIAGGWVCCGIGWIGQALINQNIFARVTDKIDRYRIAITPV